MDVAVKQSPKQMQAESYIPKLVITFGQDLNIYQQQITLFLLEVQVVPEGMKWKKQQIKRKEMNLNSIKTKE